MPYINRDKNGQITALTINASYENQEYLPATHAEVVNFLSLSGKQSLSKQALAESDAEIARITEDLIHLLIQKNIILFTDLPVAVQTKLLNREKLRSTLNQSANNFLDDSESL